VSRSPAAGGPPRADGPDWDRFLILVSRHPDDPDTYRVVFERRDPAARDAAGQPAVVIVRGGGDLTVRFVPPAAAVAGVGREDYVRKAVAVVKAQAGG
jgi:hypothetical protein